MKLVGIYDPIEILERIPRRARIGSTIATVKEDICKAFCGELIVRQVPAGLAVSTAFDGLNGDPIGFYIIGPDANGRYRIEDDGLSVSFIEASGADLSNKTRHEAFLEILSQYGAEYDEDRGELILGGLDKKSLPDAAIRFAALLLRIQDIILMAAERAASTFLPCPQSRIRSRLPPNPIGERERIPG